MSAAISFPVAGDSSVPSAQPVRLRCSAHVGCLQGWRLTAALSEGPFYPDKMPLDTDNDLLIINDAITPALGAVTWLSGRVLTASGQPIRNAFVEIWQTDDKASYIHTRGR